MDIKKVLKYHGYTISAIARELGVTQSALSQQINNGSITFAKVELIASICGCSIEEFLSCRKADNLASHCPYCGKPVSITLTKTEE